MSISAGLAFISPFASASESRTYNGFDEIGLSCALDVSEASFNSDGVGILTIDNIVSVLAGVDAPNTFTLRYRDEKTERPITLTEEIEDLLPPVETPIEFGVFQQDRKTLQKRMILLQFRSDGSPLNFVYYVRGMFPDNTKIIRVCTDLKPTYR